LFGFFKNPGVGFIHTIKEEIIMQRSRNGIRTFTLTIALIQPILLATPSYADDTGAATFNNTCAMCHKNGLMGAPKFGDAGEWGNRLKQGKSTLYTHALNGFKGKKGTMPAKGGKPNLSDKEVRAAVDYMLANSK
jgi:cytochrome c5